MPVDGFLAKRFNMTSEIGALLDPLADKALLVSIYVALGVSGAIPRWIVILVVSRDIMIVGAVIVSWLLGKPVAMKPLMVSKLNTVAQVTFAALVLARARILLCAGAVRHHLDGAGDDLDAAFGVLLSRGLGPAHERDRAEPAETTGGRGRGGNLRGRPCRSPPSTCVCPAAHGEPDPRQFPGRPEQRSRAGVDRQLAGLAEPDHAADRPRRRREKAISPRSGPSRPAHDRSVPTL